MTINNSNGVAAGSVSTTDATPATVATYAVQDDSALVARARIVARNSTTGEVAMFELRCAAKRHNAGGAVIIGAVQRPLHESDACHRLWSADLKVSGNDLIVQVKGEAGANIDWSANIDTREMYVT